jgi:hypothetical protein
MSFGRLRLSRDQVKLHSLSFSFFDESLTEESQKKSDGERAKTMLG